MSHQGDCRAPGRPWWWQPSAASVELMEDAWRSNDQDSFAPHWWHAGSPAPETSWVLGQVLKEVDCTWRKSKVAFVCLTTAEHQWLLDIGQSPPCWGPTQVEGSVDHRLEDPSESPRSGLGWSQCGRYWSLLHLKVTADISIMTCLCCSPSIKLVDLILDLDPKWIFIIATSIEIIHVTCYIANKWPGACPWNWEGVDLVVSISTHTRIAQDFASSKFLHVAIDIAPESTWSGGRAVRIFEDSQQTTIWNSKGLT